MREIPAEVLASSGSSSRVSERNGVWWGVGDSYIEAQWDQGAQQALGGVSLLLGVFASADTSHCWAHPRGFLLLMEHPSVLGSARCARRVPSWVHMEA